MSKEGHDKGDERGKGGVEEGRGVSGEEWKEEGTGV